MIHRRERERERERERDGANRVRELRKIVGVSRRNRAPTSPEFQWEFSDADQSESDTATI